VNTGDEAIPLNFVWTNSPPTNIAATVESPHNRLPTAAAIRAVIAVGSTVTPSVRKMDVTGAGIRREPLDPEAAWKWSRALERTLGKVATVGVPEIAAMVPSDDSIGTALDSAAICVLIDDTPLAVT